jgi:hypothetical protein
VAHAHAAAVGVPARGVFGCLHLFRPGWVNPYNMRNKSIWLLAEWMQHA